MASTDSFPLTPDYTLPLEYQQSVQRSRMKGGASRKRMICAPQRLWRLMFERRAMADWNTIEAFYRELIEDYFIWTDPANSRHFPVDWASEPRRDWVGNEQVNISVDLIEAVGKAPDAYAQTPLVEIPVARFSTIGNSKLICYGGYGFTMDATGVTDMKVDGVSVGAEAPVWNINLGYHRLEVIGAAPPTITEFQHVA